MSSVFILEIYCRLWIYDSKRLYFSQVEHCYKKPCSYIWKKRNFTKQIHYCELYVCLPEAILMLYWSCLSTSLFSVVIQDNTFSLVREKCIKIDPLENPFLFENFLNDFSTTRILFYSPLNAEYIEVKIGFVNNKTDIISPFVRNAFFHFTSSFTKQIMCLRTSINALLQKNARYTAPPEAFLRCRFVNAQIDGRLRCLSILLGSICIPTAPLIKTPSIYIAYAL